MIEYVTLTSVSTKKEITINTANIIYIIGEGEGTKIVLNSSIGVRVTEPYAEVLKKIAKPETPEGT